MGLFRAQLAGLTAGFADGTGRLEIGPVLSSRLPTSHRCAYLSFPPGSSPVHMQCRDWSVYLSAPETTKGIAGRRSSWQDGVKSHVALIAPLDLL